jgi:hypothetical protein
MTIDIIKNLRKNLRRNKKILFAKIKRALKKASNIPIITELPERNGIPELGSI